jgi:hypothetical protein
MIYVALVVFLVLLGFFFSKLSKVACGLMAFVGTTTLLAGSIAANLTIILFGLGLTAFSCIVFLAFNGGNA